MANHVYFNITIEGLDEGCKALEKAFPIIEGERPHWQEGEPPITYKEIIEVDKLPMYENCGQEYDEDGNQTNWYDWGCTNVGAKWISLEDWEFYDHGGYISGHSAWSHPYPFCERLAKYLSETTHNPISITMTYEDEFRNFFGVDSFYSTWNDLEGECLVDHEENYIDGSELTDIVREKFGEQIDDEDFDWWDLVETVDGDERSASEFSDDVVYNFFETGELNDTV